MCNQGEIVVLALLSQRTLLSLKVRSSDECRENKLVPLRERSFFFPSSVDFTLLGGKAIGCDSEIHMRASERTCFFPSLLSRLCLFGAGTIICESENQVLSGERL